MIAPTRQLVAQLTAVPGSIVLSLRCDTRGGVG
jgi:hypothetical protein